MGNIGMYLNIINTKYRHKRCHPLIHNTIHITIVGGLSLSFSIFYYLVFRQFEKINIDIELNRQN